MFLSRSLVAGLMLAGACIANTALAALKPGTTAPDFSAPAYLAGEPLTFQLAQALKKGPVVLYFFPAAFTPGCNIEAHLFSKAADDFRSAGATVIGLTSGNTKQLAEFSQDTKTCGGRFAVAADVDARIAGKYDARMADKPGLTARVSYVIAPDGRIVHAYADSNPQDHVKHTLQALKTFEQTRSAQ